MILFDFYYIITLDKAYCNENYVILVLYFTTRNMVNDINNSIYVLTIKYIACRTLARMVG